MGLYYPIQIAYEVFGTKNASTFALTKVALTNAYTGNRKVLSGTAGMSKMDLRFAYTTGTGETDNSIDILVEQSSDLTNWFQIPNESSSSGVSTLYARSFNFPGNATAATTVNLSLGLDIFYDNIRISVKENGVAANAGTIYMEATTLGR